MSYETTADNALERAKQNINDAITNLQIVTNPFTEGNKNYKETFIENVEEVLSELYKVRRKLK